MTKIVLLRIGDKGEPLLSNVSGGVLTFPACPPDKGNDITSPLFTLRFYIPSGSKVCNNGKVWTNLRKSHNEVFQREKFHSIDIQTSIYQDVTLDIDVFQPGSYSYYLTYNELQHDEQEIKHKSDLYNFVVPPSLFINDNYLTFNSVTMQTVVSKWVGDNMEQDWYPLFQNIKEKGYNMIHFTPLQQRGESNSPYSIYDQLSFDKTIFPHGEDDIAQMTSKLEKEYGILSMTDVVYNHTANNSDWIREHPDVGYNAETAPHLISAMELDSLLLHFSQNMKQHGYPTIIHNINDLNRIMDGIKIHVLGQLKLWQFYIVNVQEMIDQLEDYWIQKDKKTFPKIQIPYDVISNLPKLANYVKDECKTKDFSILGHRYENKLQIDKFATILASIYGIQQDFQSEIEGNARKILDEINLKLYNDYDADNETICNQLFNRIKYLFLDSNGPQLGEISIDNPLTEPYFTRFDDNNGKHWQLANNGWIWGGNPLVDFAGSQSKSYLKREVIVWGDCVKLRYGSKQEDSPYLWKRMIEYSKLSAKLFHGFRIDNCHSTPLHVGTVMLDAARSVNPNLYVVAELFSGSEEFDIMYVQQFGISSLIREAMQAHSIGELSRLCHKHGGRPIGSFRWLPLDSIAYPAHPTVFSKRCGEDIKSKSEIPIPELVTSQEPHALFMDCTHDNETPAQKRTVEDTLPTAALVSFCSCANGTTMGFDECYPKLLDIVNEKRKYTYGMDLGISKVKRLLSDIRHEIANQSIEDIERNEMYVHHENEFITIHRLNASSGRGYLLVARTKFYQDGDQDLTPIVMHGVKATPVFSNALLKKEDDDDDANKDKDDGYLHPIKTELIDLDQLTCSFDIDTNTTTISIPKYFPQGSVAVVATETIGCNEELDSFVRTGAIEASKNLSLTDINAILYRCEAEERDATNNNGGTYNIPNHGNLVYAGIQGWISILRDMIERNDLAHPLAEHLRNGKWALDYVTERLRPYENDENSIHEFRIWLESRFERIKDIPNFLVPRFFALVVGVAYEALRFSALQQMSEAIQNSTVFIQSLAMVSIQMVGLMNTASIHPFKKIPSMAAGLPHFSFDFMRCWGRDVFISARGLLLATGRYEDAKNHILCFAKTLKHGLIPNLLGSGKEPRYNARDAVWFFLQFIQDYVEIVPNGEEILKEKVKRRFPLDDTWIPFDDERAFTIESTIEEIITEILSRHAKGIKYREANAGPQIDSQMKDEGFNVEISVDWDNGLIFGGNEWNCGTWMDKMGESVRAGNKGYPGTPRAGAAIEINGLLKSALRFVIDLNKRGLFEATSVVNQHGEEIKFKDWDQLLLDNFEKCFYVPKEWSDDEKFDINPKIVNRRGIYKDIYRSHKEYEDYQLRGNFPIAYIAAPELFNNEHALNAIEMTDVVLAGPVGLRTLDPSDHEYRPYYHNGIDNDDFATSKGRNYHQGPEWVWIYGYYLRAFCKLHFAEIDRCSIERCVPSDYLLQLAWNRLAGHKKWLHNSEWAGLTELTNKDGSLCQDSSPTQAWSAACLLDFYLDAWSEYGLGEYRQTNVL